MQSPGGTRGQKGSGRPTAAVATHRYRALPRPRYGAGQYQEAPGGPRRPVGWGACCRRGPGRFGTGEEFVRRPLDGSPGAKIKFKLGGTFQIFNPNLWRVRRTARGQPETNRWAAAVKHVGASRR